VSGSLDRSLALRHALAFVLRREAQLRGRGADSQPRLAAAAKVLIVFQRWASCSMSSCGVQNLMALTPVQVHPGR